MYYQELGSLKDKKIFEFQHIGTDINNMNQVIDKLDSWIIFQSNGRRERLNPLIFSEDTGVDTELSLDLFEVVSKKGYFKKYYELFNEIDYNKSVVFRTDDLKQIRELIEKKDEVYDENNELYFLPSEEKVRICYQINMVPSSFPTLSDENVSLSTQIDGDSKSESGDLLLSYLGKYH